jgi:superfamily II DNA or RNA helicase
MEGSYLSKYGYVLQKQNIEPEELQLIKQELVGRPLTDDKYMFFNKKDNTFKVYTETKNKIYIPKMYGIRKYGYPLIENKSYIGNNWDKKIPFIGSLYPIQQEACSKLLEELMTGSSGGILSLGTGLGKTISSLYVLSQLGGKTLIIVNKISLLKQWESEIKKFLPQAKIGFIQGQKNVDTNDKDIVLGMLQSLGRIDYPDSLFEEFNTILVDEIHNICSRVFSKVLMKISCKYTIGLSATPKRSDACEYIFKWFIGDIVYQSHGTRQGLPPIINNIKIDSSEYREISTENRITGQKQIQYTSMLSELITMEKRNKLIIEIIKERVKEGRKILLLSDRREHLKILKILLDKELTTFTYGLFLGQMKISDLEKSKASDVILATYQAFGEGISEKDLDTLILATPKKFIGHIKSSAKAESGKLEQIVGRIFRKEHVEKNPVIIDFNDNFSVYKNQYRQRQVFYKQHFSEILFKEQSIKLDDIKLDQININQLQTKKDQTKQLNEKSINDFLITQTYEIEEEELSKNLYNSCLLD